ncbi:MAG: YgjV family protein [Clostridia bacterium]|nr:YgjV family protein [Clostridia bacterium]
MENATLSFIAGLFAMALIVISYFTDKKTLYLILQASSIVFLILSYLFISEFFAMVGLSVGLGRALTFFVYENKNKPAPLWLSFLFSALTLLAYVIVNVVILKNYEIWDVLYLTALIFYAFTFRIRNLSVLRLVTIIPTGLSVVYGFGISATAFVIISYIFEFLANLFAIIKQNILPKYKSKYKIQNN